MSRHLVAILHSRPPGDGERTLSRIELARAALGCGSFSVTNLYPASLPNTGALSLSANLDVWQLGRDEVSRDLRRTDTTDILLGYGVKPPTGTQRHAFREQLDWLAVELNAQSHRVWAFGGRPNHPSRWQRVAHRYAPDMPIQEIVPVLLAPFKLGQQKKADELVTQEIATLTKSTFRTAPSSGDSKS